MSSEIDILETFDAEAVLATLKDFQRKTVEYAFDRMYGEGGADRFLIADEVGLGKTLVAKGIVAKVVDELRRKPGHRIDVVYLCANRDIARQNISRLNLFGADRVSQAGRLTLLPLHLKQLEKGPNFIAFTPATALELTGATGTGRERALLHWMICDAWGLSGAALRNFFQVYKGNDSWEWEIERLQNEITKLGGAIDAGVRQRFASELANVPALRANFDSALEHFVRRRDNPRNVPQEARELRDPLIGKFRECLARACLAALEPDLIILDEFQRFSSLLGDDESEEGKEIAELGRQFLDYPGSKILLLSATPYKAYTLAREDGADNHHKDFLRVASFLMNHPERFGGLQSCLKEFNEAIFDSSAEGAVRLTAAKASMEASLRRHIVRTERLGVTADRDGMIEEMPLPACRLEPQDLEAFKALDSLATSLEQPDVMEYWKSAPYVLNFMEHDGYVLKRELVERIETGSVGVADEQSAGLRNSMLSSNALNAFSPLDAQNSKLRALVSAVLDKGAWKLLWMPPSLPYYQSPGTPYEDAARDAVSKILVFSNWRFVPRAIAGLISYETERRIAGLSNGSSQYGDFSSRSRRPLLTFSLDEQGRPRDLNHLVPLYPSPSLCELLDPLEESKGAVREGRSLDHSSLLDRVTAQISGRLRPLSAAEKERSSDREDQHWYCAAMLESDLKRYEQVTNAWFSQQNPWSGFVEAKSDEHSGFKVHVDQFLGLGTSGDLGKMPGDLASVLAKLAIGSPAVVALRSFRRLARSQGVTGYPGWLLDAAARVGLAFRTLFNQPDAIVLTRALYGGDEGRYWEAMLDHCIAGNLQALIDEHVHVLRESLGVSAVPAEDAIGRIAEEIISALSIKATVLRIDDFKVGDSLKIEKNSISMRCRGAVRFAADPGEDDGGDTFADQVRIAFNSPFRLFVLASTAVGQEGLDFHLWCHSIFHWNLPSNPVDFEQREGRIHRYKGQVIRRSIASSLGIAEVLDSEAGSDPWSALFAKARAARSSAQNDLVPYWVFNGNGKFKIRRYVPALPLSRERAAAVRLRSALGAYRLVFGQPRQEDLLAFLQSANAGKDISSELYAIDLSPAADS